MRRCLPLMLMLLLAGSGGRPRPAPVAAPPWGSKGHTMAARAAVESLPVDVPEFFRAAGDQLVYLNPEPDRWRSSNAREMDQAWDYDHYIDIENLPAGALEAPDRFAYLDLLYRAGVPRPVRSGGFLPFRIVELYQRIVVEWRAWHDETDPDRRRWIEARIIDDAGVLGHYVTDGSQPHHTTIHFNGWNPRDGNPEGYTEDRDFHARFETRFVSAHVDQTDVTSRVPPQPRDVSGSARSAVIEFLMETHELVPTLYGLDRDVGFAAAGTAAAPARDFAAERLAAGSAMLATLWWSAWIEGRGGDQEAREAARQ